MGIAFDETVLGEKYMMHDSFRQLIAQNRDGKIHALQISTESSVRAAQERAKADVTGNSHFRGLHKTSCEIHGRHRNKKNKKIFRSRLHFGLLSVVIDEGVNFSPSNTEP